MQVKGLKNTLPLSLKEKEVAWNGARASAGAEPFRQHC